MRKSAKDLLETSDEDMTNLKSQLLDLTTRWDNVNQLNSNKDARLQVQIRRGWPSDYPKTETLSFLQLSILYFCLSGLLTVIVHIKRQLFIDRLYKL